MGTFNYNKYLVLFCILAIAGIQVHILVSEFWDTRIIEVRKEIEEGNEDNYLKGYDIRNIPFEQYNIKVKPRSFWDYLLLTNKDGNCLSITLVITAHMFLCWYIYKLDFNDSFSLKHLKWIEWAFAFYFFGFCMIRSTGLEHTADFWSAIEKAHPPSAPPRYYYIETDDNEFVYLLIMWGSGALITNFQGFSPFVSRRPQVDQT